MKICTNWIYEEGGATIHCPKCNEMRFYEGKEERDKVTCGCCGKKFKLGMPFGCI